MNNINHFDVEYRYAITRNNNSRFLHRKMTKMAVMTKPSLINLIFINIKKRIIIIIFGRRKFPKSKFLKVKLIPHESRLYCTDSGFPILFARPRINLCAEHHAKQKKICGYHSFQSKFPVRSNHQATFTFESELLLAKKRVLPLFGRPPSLQNGKHAFSCLPLPDPFSVFCYFSMVQLCHIMPLLVIKENC